MDRRRAVNADQTMFDEGDPYLSRVRELASNLPEMAEKISHGRPAFYTKKIFAYYGGALKEDATWVQHPHSIVVLPDEDERHALLSDARVYVPAYLGPSGWIGVDLDDSTDSTDWTEVAELVEESYRLTAPRRCIDSLKTL
jgi:predicted DNA-binding protein (MmcQ/YjbR family)